MVNENVESHKHILKKRIYKLLILRIDFSL